MKYSTAAHSFYAPEFDYSNPPTDLIDVSQADYEAAIAARSEGCSIAFENGALVITAAPTPPEKTQSELDYDRYIKRSQAKEKILAEFAAENMGRVRAGIWTVPNLIALTQDAQLILLLANINTLSFELAIATVQGITNPLITTEIKAAWVAKLQANLFLVP